MQDEAMMQAALAAAYGSARSGAGGPFGACIALDGRILAAAGNHVLGSHDPTAHAEVTAIREACAALATHHLPGADIYSTTEPCPMCFAAIHWAQIGRIVYGTSIADVKRLGFNELTIPNQQMKAMGGSPVEIVPEFMRAECLNLLDFWASLDGRETY